MTEIQPVFRNLAADALDRDNTVTYRNGRSAGDLVRAVASSEMFSTALPFGSNTDGRVRSEATDACLSWRFLVHIEGYPTGMQLIKCGLALEPWTDEDVVMERLEVEMAFDDVVEGSVDKTVRGLIDYVGDEIIEESYKSDRPFFACLEHRYGNGRGWPELIYPPELTKTVEAVQRQNAAMIRERRRPNSWMEQAAKSGPTNRARVANAMALSVFWRIQQLGQANYTS